MGCDDAARVRDQGLVGCGLVGEHVERGAADAAHAAAGNALVQCGDQGILIHDGPAGRVDQKRRGFHERKFALANQLLGLWNQRTVQADDIGGAEQLIERLSLDATCGGKLFCTLGWRPHQHSHAECLCDGHHGTRDTAKKDEPQCTALRAVHGVAGKWIPSAITHTAVEQRDLSHQVEHQGNGVLSDIVRAVPGTVGDGDAMGGKAVDGNVVQANGHIRDNAHPRGGHGVGTHIIDGAELADKALAADQLLGSGADIGLVRAANQLNLVATLDCVEHRLARLGRTVDHVIEHPMLHNSPPAMWGWGRSGRYSIPSSQHKLRWNSSCLGARRLVSGTISPQLIWGCLGGGGARSRSVICVGVRAARYTGTAQTMALPAGAPSVR